MSYARFGSGGSDVYVFLCVYGWLECCGCWLNETEWAFNDTAEMLAHLEEHRKAGHTVLDSTIEGLKEDQAENDKWIADYRAGAVSE